MAVEASVENKADYLTEAAIKSTLESQVPLQAKAESLSARAEPESASAVADASISNAEVTSVDPDTSGEVNDIEARIEELQAELDDAGSDKPEYEPITIEEMGYDVPFNTTISCLITNAKLTKPQANKLASILHDGYARAIKPVHSTLDGDAIFVMSTNQIEVNFDAFAALATDILQYSVIDSALAATDAYGLKSSRSIIGK